MREKIKEIRRKKQADRSVVPSLRKSAQRRSMMPEARNRWTTTNCNVIGAYPRALLLSSEYLDNV